MTISLRGALRRSGVLAVPVALFCAVAASAAPAEEPAPLTAAGRVVYYAAQIERSPRLYPLHTQLALACLDRARETHDPAWLVRARAEATTAQSLQDNYDSLLALAAIANYSHRFAEALRWAQRAAEAAVNGPGRPDPFVSAALVEAHLGLGQVDEARRFVPATAAGAADPHTALSLGQWLAASSRFDDAAAAYGRAAALAKEGDDPSLAALAEAMAAGAMLDAARPAEARPCLERAARLDGTLPAVVVHQAELEMAEGRPLRALEILEAHLAVNPDPAVAARACEAALKAGETARADRHCATAEQGLQRAIDAGEIYTLGALAQLYLTTGRNLDRALALAQENLTWKRDREARATLAAVRQRLAERPGRP